MCGRPYHLNKAPALQTFGNIAGFGFSLGLELWELAAVDVRLSVDRYALSEARSGEVSFTDSLSESFGVPASTGRSALGPVRPRAPFTFQITTLCDIVTGPCFGRVSHTASIVSVANAAAIATLSSWNGFTPDVQAWEIAL